MCRQEPVAQLKVLRVATTRLQVWFMLIVKITNNNNNKFHAYIKHKEGSNSNTFLSPSVASWNFEFSALCSSVLSWLTRRFSITGILDFCCMNWWAPSVWGVIGTCAGSLNPTEGDPARAPEKPCCGKPNQVWIWIIRACLYSIPREKKGKWSLMLESGCMYNCQYLGGGREGEKGRERGHPCKLA